MHVSSFIEQRENEKVQYILHRHPLTFIPSIVLFLLLSAVPVAVYFLIRNFAPNLLAEAGYRAISILFASVYYLGCILFFYTEFIVYYLDVWIVTNDRVIDVEQLSLFSRSISELDLYNIQDVTSDIKGFFPTIFHYGTVTVKTASTNPNILFRDIPNPDKVREDLIELADLDRIRDTK